MKKNMTSLIYESECVNYSISVSSQTEEKIILRTGVVIKLNETKLKVMIFLFPR